MTVRSLLSTIDSAELTEWMAFERLEPFGSLVDDYRSGTIAATIANVNRASSKDHYFAPDEFAPSVRNAKTRVAAPAKSDELTDEQHTALFDACIFGMTKK